MQAQLDTRDFVPAIAATDYGGASRPVTPEGLDGHFLSIQHIDYICVRDTRSVVRLYPIDDGEPRPMAGVTETDEVLGGSANSDVVYGSPDPSGIPRQIVKVDIATGRRHSFVTISPSDPAGIVSLFLPIFSADEKRYVYTQVRDLSILYVGTGLT